MKINDRFTYQEGDITLRKSQCGLCEFNVPTKLENGRPTCCYFTDGKPMEILINKRKCPHFTHSDSTGQIRQHTKTSYPE